MQDKKIYCSKLETTLLNSVNDFLVRSKFHHVLACNKLLQMYGMNETRCLCLHLNESSPVLKVTCPEVVHMHMRIIILCIVYLDICVFHYYICTFIHDYH